VPIADIIPVATRRAFRLTAGTVPLVRRTAPRAHDHQRLRGRIMEFAGVVAVGASLAGAALILVEEAFARPLAMLQGALAG
jgi:hypothetical protein